jgi:hypothetical protein
MSDSDQELNKVCEEAMTVIEKYIPEKAKKNAQLRSENAADTIFHRNIIKMEEASLVRASMYSELLASAKDQPILTLFVICAILSNKDSTLLQEKMREIITFPRALDLLKSRLKLQHGDDGVFDDKTLKEEIINPINEKANMPRINSKDVLMHFKDVLTRIHQLEKVETNNQQHSQQR